MRARSLRLLIVCALAVTAGVAARGPHAQGSAIKFGIQDDAWLLHGPGSLDDRLDTVSGLGARIVRLSLHWNEIAAGKPAAATDPDDPAYDWSGYDEALDGLHQRNIDVLL